MPRGFLGGRSRLLGSDGRFLRLGIDLALEAAGKNSHGCGLGFAGDGVGNCVLLQDGSAGMQWGSAELCQCSAGRLAMTLLGIRRC